MRTSFLDGVFQAVWGLKPGFKIKVKISFSLRLGLGLDGFDGVKMKVFEVVRMVNVLVAQLYFTTSLYPDHNLYLTLTSVLYSLPVKVMDSKITAC